MLGCCEHQMRSYLLSTWAQCLAYSSTKGNDDSSGGGREKPNTNFLSKARMRKQATQSCSLPFTFSPFSSPSTSQEHLTRSQDTWLWMSTCYLCDLSHLTSLRHFFLIWDIDTLLTLPGYCRYQMSSWILKYFMNYETLWNCEGWLFIYHRL